MDGTVTVLLNEQALVARAVAEPEAFAAIYDHYFPRVYNYVRYRVQEAGAADDITAQVFERALVKLGSYHAQRGSFAAWLFGIARNAVRDHGRGQSRRGWLSLDGLHDQPSPEPGPEQLVVRDETHGALLEAVASLKERERELIALKFGAEMNNRQIAELTGLSESNVGVSLYRAVRRLRRMWNERTEKAHE
jgi:RNA polymerase sigma factor (sigma-70 family)